MSLAGQKILIVDDDMRNVFALTAALERQQVQVVSVQSGEAAIDALAADDSIRIVLMDVMMPGMDGYQTMRIIREDLRFRDLPIIALTAKAMQGDREQCLQAGASGYLSKPVKLEDLMEVMEQLLAKKRRYLT
ncbi:MAG: response regulator [Magnetospirillum sp.]|nr:response regulator [Magnetospirillum sp.]